MKPFLRAPLIGTGPLFAASHRREPRIPFAWHYHTEFELVLIVHSQGMRHVGDSIEDYRDGDLVLFGPGLPHSYASDEHDDATCEQVVVHFDVQLLGPGALEDPELASVASLFRNAARGVLFGPATRARVEPWLKDLPTLPPLSRLACLLRIIEALSLSDDWSILSTAEFAPGMLADSDERPVNRVLRHLQKNLGRPVPVAEAAAVAAMSPSSFTRFFRRATGRSFNAYLNEMRLRRACQLLLDTDRGIEDIASAAGFAGVSYFYRRFVKGRGMTPAAFRRTNAGRTTSTPTR